MHHGKAEESTFHLTPRPNHIAHRQRFLLRGIKTEKAHCAGVRAVVHRHQQLAARAVGDLAFSHHALNLHRIAFSGIAQLGEAGFVLVAQRQVQSEVNIAVQAQLGNTLLQMRFFVRSARLYL